jgi:Highly conserved protein containing a thioredoxin domain
MTATLERNRLDEEESPYLRDHAENPVNWQPWEDETLAAAREQDKPIFLSVGYAACHWCHVMADESFDDEAVAAVLNEEFVPIKVDREERPDIDSIYQTVCQRVSGRGGWPLSAWLTPEGEPFQVGTYFPPEPRRGMPGFLDLLEDIAAAWNDPEEREKMESRAAQWTAMVEGELEEVPDSAGTLDEGVLETAAEAAVRSADRQDGGWGSGPKFPQTGRLQLLARARKETGRDAFEEVLVETLDAMADGGMYDHVGGGFHRYATDGDWTVPHFEKMLYDNAQLPRAYLAGYRVTGDDRYAEVVRETLAFVERELTHPEGGFFSTLGAQSEWEGEQTEGAFYVWTPEQVHDALDDEAAAAVFCDRYGVTETGNFEGRTVLTRSRPPARVSADREESQAEVTELLTTAREDLLAAREQRPRPPRDEKVLAGWNGLMISAFAEAALVLDREYADPAATALEFVRDELWDGTTLSRRYSDGVVKIDGYLEDYAFLARGALDLFGATRDPEHLFFALELASAIEREFWDEDAGTLYFTPADGESLIARPQELTDQSTPASIGVAAEVLDALDPFRPGREFAEIATQVVETHGSRIESNPLQHASLTLAADTVTRGVLELTMVADEPPEDWYDTLANRHLDPSALFWRPVTEETRTAWLDILGLDEEPAVWADRELKNDEPTVYACRAQTCSPPRNELTRTLNWAERML